MKSQSAVMISRALKWTVALVLAVNILALFAVPFMLSMRFNTGFEAYWSSPGAWTFFPSDRAAWPEFLWRLCFYEICGMCTAVMLWQARGVLSNLAGGRPFTVENADRIMAAAMCFFVISGTAFCRFLIELFTYGLARTLMMYNTLFVPAAVCAGLLCLVLSELFRQASRLREDNDLVI